MRSILYKKLHARRDGISGIMNGFERAHGSGPGNMRKRKKKEKTVDKPK